MSSFYKAMIFNYLEINYDFWWYHFRIDRLQQCRRSIFFVGAILLLGVGLGCFRGMERSKRSCGKPLCDTSIVFDPCTIRPGIGRGTDPGDADGLSLSRIAVHRRLALSLAQFLFICLVCQSQRRHPRFGRRKWCRSS